MFDWLKYLFFGYDGPAGPPDKSAEVNDDPYSWILSQSYSASESLSEIPECCEDMKRFWWYAEHSEYGSFHIRHEIMRFKQCPYCHFVMY